MKKICSIIFLIPALIIIADEPNIYHRGIYFTNNNNVAINGYDVVSYFQDGPEAGVAEHAVEYEGVLWFFVSEENAELFRNSPLSYIPQYGGYCAWAIGAKNETADIRPDQWDIVDGKLYLNYNFWTRGLWLLQQQDLIEQADQNWPLIRQLLTSP